VREVAPHPAVISMTLAKIERDTRQRELREAHEAHERTGKVVLGNWRTGAMNGLIIATAFGIAAWIVYEIITEVIDVILRAFGQ
jgi:hypothetical protein